MMKKILFIINPISGVGKQKNIQSIIDKRLNKSNFICEIKYTEAPKHATQISSEAVGKYDAVIAVGGDGTVNEVSAGLIGSKTPLGIIPSGSGNGLARFLHIPLKIKKAIELINQFEIQAIDSLTINNIKFVNLAGIGFDALISHQFANYGKRGLWSYVKIIIKEFYRFKPLEFTCNIDGKIISKKLFMISFANSSQFGNNAHIAPNAKINDGLIDICMLRQFPLIVSPIIAFRLFNKTMHKSKYIEIIKGKSIQIAHHSEIIAHVDGEPILLTKNLKIDIRPLSLNVIVPKNFH